MKPVISWDFTFNPTLCLARFWFQFSYVIFRDQNNVLSVKIWLKFIVFVFLKRSTEDTANDRVGSTETVQLRRYKMSSVMGHCFQQKNVLHNFAKDTHISFF